MVTLEICRIALIWICLMISHHSSNDIHFLKEYQRNNAEFFLVNHIKWFIILIHFTIHVNKFNHLLKVASMSLHGKVTVFPFVLNKSLGEIL